MEEIGLTQERSLTFDDNKPRNHLEMAILQILAAKTHTSEFEWKARKPTESIFSSTWYHSLEDTPEQYQNTQTKSIELRSAVLSYLEKKNPGTRELLAAHPPEYTIRGSKSIFNQILPEDLLYLTFFDLGTWFGGEQEIYVNLVWGRFSSAGINISARSSDIQLDSIDWQTLEQIVLAILDNRRLETLADDNLKTLSPEVRNYFDDELQRTKLLKSHQIYGLDRLSDSVSSVQYW